MKWPFFIIIILLIFSCSKLSRVPAGHSTEKEMHIVFDIDWTLVSNYDGTITTAPPDKILKVENKEYIVRDGVADFVETLIRRDVKVSFFSGGSATRNKELLTKIKLSDGRSLFDIAYKIKNFEDLTSVRGVSENAKFTEKYKKDLRKISNDLKNIIIIDDNANFYLNEIQKKNFISIGPTFKYFETFEDSMKYQGEYIPKNFKEWDDDRHIMERLQKQIESVLNLSESRKIGLLESRACSFYIEPFLGLR